MDWSDRIGRRIKLRDLHVLLATIQSGSMVSAAARLSVSQPVVSKAISELEAAVGVRLLERHRDGVTPTAYGLALMQRSMAAFDELRQAVNDIEYLSDPTAGELRVAGPGTVVGGLFPAAIQRLTRRHPKLRIEVKEIANVVEQFNSLRERRIDVVIRRMPHSLAEDHDLEAESLYDDPPLIAAGAGNPLTRRRRIQLAELVDERWVLPPPETDVSHYINELFVGAGLKSPKAQVICPSMEMNHALLTFGGYLAFYPGSLLMFGAKRLPIKALRVDLPKKEMSFAAIRLKSRMRTPIENMFLSSVRELIAPLKSWLQRAS
jgi:DNA-binding transcriptional LysR family regulator